MIMKIFSHDIRLCCDCRGAVILSVTHQTTAYRVIYITWHPGEKFSMKIGTCLQCQPMSSNVNLIYGAPCMLSCMAALSVVLAWQPTCMTTICWWQTITNGTDFLGQCSVGDVTIWQRFSFHKCQIIISMLTAKRLINSSSISRNGNETFTDKHCFLCLQ